MQKGGNRASALSSEPAGAKSEDEAKAENDEKLARIDRKRLDRESKYKNEMKMK